MKYPKPDEFYSCEVICENFMEIEEKLKNIDNDSGGSGLPNVTTEDNGKHLEVVDGEWVVKTPETSDDSPERMPLVEEQTLPFNVENGLGILEITEPSMVVPVVEGETYIVALDGTEYECVGVLLSTEIDGSPLNYYYIGNASIVNMGENTSEPFVFVYILESNSNVAIVSGEDTTHIVGIYREETKGLPKVTTEDNGKFLQVVNGKWRAVAITNGNEVAY